MTLRLHSYSFDSFLGGDCASRNPSMAHLRRWEGYEKLMDRDSALLAV